MTGYHLQISTDGMWINKAVAHRRPDSNMLEHIGLYQVSQCREFPQCIILVICFITGRSVKVGGKFVGSLGCVKDRLCAAEFVGDKIVCVWCEQSTPAVYVYSADTQHYQTTEDATVNPWHTIN